MSKSIHCKNTASVKPKWGYSTFFTAILVLLITLPIQLFAQGNLLITPRRVVFEGNKKSQEVNLANTGQDTAIYSVSFVQYRMTEEGSFEQIEEPDPEQLFSSDYVRFFPRMVTLPPGEAQVIRMQVRRRPGMADGEYRSHMYFRAVPQERPLGEDPLLEDTTAIGIRLTPIFGITIPVILRVGNLNAEVTLTDINLETNDENKTILSLAINRAGHQSVYGDLSVNYIPSRGAGTEVGIVRGLAVYTPNSTRHFSMELQTPEGVDFSDGKLQITFSSQGDTDAQLFAESEYSLD